MRPIKYLSIILIAALALPTFLSARFSVHEYTQAIEASPKDMKYKFYLLRGKVYKDFGEMNFALKDLNLRKGNAFLFHILSFSFCISNAWFFISFNKNKLCNTFVRIYFSW